MILSSRLFFLHIVFSDSGVTPSRFTAAGFERVSYIPARIHFSRQCEGVAFHTDVRQFTGKLSHCNGFRKVTAFHGNDGSTIVRIRIRFYLHRISKYCGRIGCSAGYRTPILIAGCFQRYIRFDRERARTFSIGKSHSVGQKVFGDCDFRCNRFIFAVAGCYKGKKEQCQQCQIITQMFNGIFLNKYICT